MRKALSPFLFLILMPGLASGGPSNFISTLKIGAGGWLVGIDISAVGAPILMRTDTYGCYAFNSSTGAFSQLVTQKSMPAAQFGYYPTRGLKQVNQNGGGCYEIASAPSNPSIGYMAFNDNVFRTSNLSISGTMWSYLPGFSKTQMNAADVCYRMNGRKMAVDPVDENVVMLGTDTAGVFYTINSGATFSSISSLPTAGMVTAVCSGYPSYQIAFDSAGGTTTCSGVTVTKNVFVFPGLGSGTNVFKSTTGVCGKFTATSGGPTTAVSHMVAANGVVWAVEAYAAGQGSNSTLWAYVDGAWKKVLSRSNILHSIAVDPANGSHVVMVDAGGNLYYCPSSCATGSNWSGPVTFIQSTSGVTNPVGWLANTNDYYMSAGDIAFSPSESDVLWFSWGFGAAYTTPPTSNSAFTWNIVGAGIEQLDSIAIVVSGSCPIMTVLDRGTFTNCTPDDYPTTSTPLNQTYGLVAAYGIDAVGSYVAANLGLDSGSGADYSSYSTDNGANWSLFNSWSATVAATTSTVVKNRSNFVRMTVPSTSGLASWSNGSGSILTVLASASGQAAKGAFASNWGLYNGAYPITVVDETHIDFQNVNGRSWNPAWQQAGISYNLYRATEPLTSYSGAFNVANVSNSGGAIKITVANNPGNLLPGQHVHISGVAGTTEANGDWVLISASGNDVVLYGSTFVHSYVSGGILEAPAPSGAMSVDTTTHNIVRIASNNNYPICSIDGGQTWSEIHEPGAPINSAIIAAKWSSVAGGTLTFATAASHSIPVGGGFTVANMTPNGYNGAFIAGPGTAGTTLIAIKKSSDPGSASAMGYEFPETGWGAAYYHYWSRPTAADRFNARTIYLYNYLSGFYVMQNCATSLPVDSTDTALTQSHYGANSAANFVMKTVPGEAGHVFLAVGPAQGGSHPGAERLWRYCGAGIDKPFQVSGFYEPQAIGFGAVKPGESYPSIYVVGWYGLSQATAVYGLYRSVDDPNHGRKNCLSGGNWQLITNYPIGLMSGVGDVTGSATFGYFYISNGNGFAWGYHNFLLKRDLNPASNDNSPEFLNQVS